MNAPNPDPEAAVAALVDELTRARDAITSLLGVTPSGVRAVEIADGRRAHLAAVPPDGVACLIGGRIARSRRDVRQIVTAGLVWEHVEHSIDPERLAYLNRAAARAIAALGDDAAVVDSLGALIEAVDALGGWRTDPLRARASFPEVDRGALLQDRAWRAYGAFVWASEPLAHRQDDLPVEVVSALRVLEEAAGRAGVTERLAEQMGQVVRACDDAAPEIVDRHVTPLE